MPVGHYANASGGCQECLVPPAPGPIVVPVSIVMAAPPGSILVEITIAMSTSVIEIVEVPVPAMTPITIVRPVHVAPRAAPIPATIAGVMAVNKLFTLLIQSTTASLG